MARWFNIGGPCIAAKHYMLPAAARLLDVMSLIRKGLVVADPDFSKPWDGKITSEDIAFHGKTIHLVTC